MAIQRAAESQIAQWLNLYAISSSQIEYCLWATGAPAGSDGKGTPVQSDRISAILTMGDLDWQFDCERYVNPILYVGAQSRTLEG